MLQKNRVAQCHQHGRNEFADWGEYCGRLGGSCTHTISLTVIWKKKIWKEFSINFDKGNLRGDNICHITISIWHFSNWQKTSAGLKKVHISEKKRVKKLETSLKKGQKVLRLSLCRIVPYVDVTGWHSSYITQNHRAVGR